MDNFKALALICEGFFVLWYNYVMADLEVEFDEIDMFEEIQNTIDEQDAILLYILDHGFNETAKTMLVDYMEFNKGIESRLICLN